MKKLYFLAAFISVCFATTGFGQYTAIRSGNWSDPITWNPSGKPSTICNNCTVTINSGVTVQLDEHAELSGTSILYLGNSGVSGDAKIVVGNSSQTTIASAYNIVLDTLPGNSMIVLSNASSQIDATAAGAYDGIFVGPFPNSIYQKVIGNAPSLFQGNSIIGTSKPSINVLNGPVILFSGGTLPIILTNFNAVLSNNVVKVTWTTEQESNLNDFLVKRSGDGITWETISKIPARGSSSETTNYSFIDPAPLHGINYYRIQSVDNSGSYKLSEVKLIRGLFIKGISIVNPAKDHLRITFGSDITSNLTLRLFNQSGQLLQQKQLSNAAGSTVLLPVRNYPQGIYTVHVKAADGSQNAYSVFISH